MGYQFVVELKKTAKLAWPMALTQVGQIVMTATDLAFIGHIGTEAVAAAGLAGRVYILAFTFGAAFLAPIAPLAAQAFGANNLAMVRSAMRIGLWAAMMLSFVIMAFALCGERAFQAFGQAPDTARLAQIYLFGLAWGAPPALGFVAIRSFMGAVNRPEPIFWITLAAIPINTLLAYLMIYGRLGLPRLELLGAALATTFVNCATFSAGLWFVTMRRPFRDYHVLAQFWRFDWPLARQLIGIGAPSSIATLMGFGAALAGALLVGLIGTSALAAHQIALQVTMILSMVHLGVSTAAAVRVAQAVGRNNYAGIKRAGLAAILLGIVIAVTLTIPVIAMRVEIAALFLDESAVDAHTTIEVAAKLLLIGGTVSVADAVQLIGVGSLRGLKDTRVPLLFVCIAYLLIGFSLSYLLGFKADLGVTGIWIGSSIGTTIYAVLIVLRFHLLTSSRLAS
ncbi:MULTISPECIES: MATE family efflux transporter [unclassified Bradyrhizobium]|uniref:MATE family efflux transporter n=1 Tax=unclassified Bradyrhizobium TaxID=2631580 RepID=UPI002478E50C|nr:MULTISPECIES: MATE family efflux transporter [unclassified Bradyrhizobium]WGS19214.1 MATE family efflux transporter [Bradyrhizobium sp. ISRA463]WGS26051.1 MATE family efflux transporter [Bradyrhizobium sp. ISRA464]